MKITYYQASFKKPKSGRLKWLTTVADTEREAYDKLIVLAAKTLPGYRLYGGPLRIKS